MSIKKIHVWDLPDTSKEPDGYDWKTVAKLSEPNLNIVIEKLNEVIDAINNSQKQE